MKHHFEMNQLHFPVSRYENELPCGVMYLQEICKMLNTSAGTMVLDE
jgi:hypothetical protein